MYRHPRLTLGSAIAAAVALSVLLVTPRGSVLQAGTIMRSFTDRIQQNGLRLSFENIGDEGVRVRGRFFLDFGRDAAGQPDYDANNDRLLIEAHVKADDDAPDVGGLELDAKIVLARGENWVYFRPTGIPASLEEEEPAAVALFNWASGGVLLDLNEISKFLDSEQMDEIRSIPGQVIDALRDAYAEMDDELAAATLVSGADESDTPDADAAQQVRSQIRVQTVHQARVATHDAAQPRPIATDDPQLAAALMALASGHATPEQIQRLVESLGQAAKNVNVQQVAPGVHVLTASGFSPEALDLDDDPDASRWLKRMEFSVTYREKVGVEAARITHLGPYDGVINFEMTDAPIDPSLLSSAVYRGDGRTTVLNLGSLMQLAESLGGVQLQADPK